MNLFEYVAKGGLIAYLLVVVNVIGLSIMFWKVLVLKRFRSNEASICAGILESAEQEGGLSSTENTVLAVLRSRVREFIEEVENGLNTVRIIATVSPLIGLLGTVVGIVGAFEGIAVDTGIDPRVMADHISLALITTVMGLVVAVPHYVGYNYFISYIDRLESRMEKNTIQRFYEKKLQVDMGVWKDAMKNIRAY